VLAVVVKVNDPDVRMPLSNVDPSFEVMLCGRPSVRVHTTTSPGLMVVVRPATPRFQAMST